MEEVRRGGGGGEGGWGWGQSCGGGEAFRGERGQKTRGLTFSKLPSGSQEEIAAGLYCTRPCGKKKNDFQILSELRQ